MPNLAETFATLVADGVSPGDAGRIVAAMATDAANVAASFAAPTAAAPSIGGGKCAWAAYGPDGSRGDRCDAPTAPKGDGSGPRRYCKVHHAPFRRANTPASVSEARDADVQAWRDRRDDNATAFASATGASAKVAKRGKAASVRILPPTCSFALYVRKHGEDAGLTVSGSGGALAVAFDHEAAATAFVKALSEHTWGDAQITIPDATVKVSA